MKTFFVLVFFIPLLNACSTKVLRPDLEDQISSQPQMEDYHDRWFLGLVRTTKAYTNPEEACVNETPVKTMDLLSLEDFLLGVITFGIYTPATTRVWCVNETESRTETR